MIVVILSVLPAFAYYVLVLLQENDTPLADEYQFSGSYQSEVPKELIQLRSEGKLAEAVTELERLQSTLAEPNAQALATFNATMLRFQLTSDFSTYLEDIRNLKSVVLDPDVDQWVRIKALNSVSAAYCRSGRDPRAFEEIYKGEPFEKYLVPGDPDLSARKLAEWSYSIRPTSFAAARIARWYSETIMHDDSLDETTRNQYLEETTFWIREADRLVARELRDPTFINTMQYATYDLWTTVATGRLAAVVGEPYRSEYRSRFENLFATLKNNPNYNTEEFVFLGLHFYAQLLESVDSDTAAAKARADELAGMIDSLENPEIMTYVRFLRNEYAHRSSGYIWQNTLALMNISPAYKASVERLLAVSNR